jgi:hypothetical protein
VHPQSDPTKGLYSVERGKGVPFPLHPIPYQLPRTTCLLLPLGLIHGITISLAIARRIDFGGKVRFK